MAKYTSEVMLGAFILGAGGLLAYMSVAVGGINLTPGFRVTARFANASGLVKDAAVAIAGVGVGHVESLAVEHDHAKVVLFLNKSAGVRADVSAAIRAKSLLGEKYVELRPQSETAPFLAEGGTIEKADSPVEMDELITAMKPLMAKVKPEDVGTIVNTLAKALDGNADKLHQTIGDASSMVAEAKDMLHGSRPKLDRITDNLEALTRDGREFMSAHKGELGSASKDLAALAKDLRQASPELKELSHRAQQIAKDLEGFGKEMKARGPRMARNTDAVLAKLPGTLEDLNKLQADLNKVLGKANPMLDKTNSLLDKANAIDEAYVRKFTHDELIKNGIKVHVHPPLIMGTPNP